MEGARQEALNLAEALLNSMTGEKLDFVLLPPLPFSKNLFDQLSCFPCWPECTSAGCGLLDPGIYREWHGTTHLIRPVRAVRSNSGLGRDTFRGPAFHNVDLSLIKETPLSRERIKVQFRAEIFNVFNLVNFGLPANILLGPGFGVINRTVEHPVRFSCR